MRKWLFFVFCLSGAASLPAQLIEVGMEPVFGSSVTTFRGDLAGIVGFSELELTEADVDSALADIDITAPRWLKELYPGIRITVDQQIKKTQTRTIKGVRFYTRVAWFGGSFSVSDPRLTEPLEAQKLKNQLKAVSLSLGGKADELAEHLALMALADADRVDPFFSKRYDLDAYVHLKKLFLGEDPLMEWGKNNSLDVEVTTGIRFTADPSPVVDLGSILFIRDHLDSLMEGGILAPVENTTDAIAGAIQNIVFGKFRDPRVVPSMGWFLRGQAPVHFGGAFSLLAGAEFSMNKHLSIKGTSPMFSLYGYLGFRLNFVGEKRK